MSDGVHDFNKTMAMFDDKRRNDGPMSANVRLCYKCPTTIELKAEIERLRAQAQEHESTAISIAEHAVEAEQHMKAEIERLRAENKEFQELLDGRDSFIVNKGMWQEFTSTLPRGQKEAADV